MECQPYTAHLTLITAGSRVNRVSRSESDSPKSSSETSGGTTWFWALGAKGILRSCSVTDSLWNSSWISGGSNRALEWLRVLRHYLQYPIEILS